MTDSAPSPDPQTLRQLQQTVDSWIHSIGVRYFSPLSNLAQLVEEVGELARALNRHHGDQSFKPGESAGELADELADVLFVVTCLANQCGVDLQEAVAANLRKKTARDSGRHRDNPKLASRGEHNQALDKSEDKQP